MRLAMLTRHLKHPDLFCSIDRVPALPMHISGRTFEVTNPSTGELLAELPDMGVEETRAAIDKAYVAQVEWAALTPRERSDTLWRWHQLIVTHTDDLAAILTAEMGKTLAEASCMRRRSAMVCRGSQPHLWRDDFGTVDRTSHDGHQVVPRSLLLLVIVTGDAQNVRS